MPYQATVTGRAMCTEKNQSNLVTRQESLIVDIYGKKQRRSSVYAAANANTVYVTVSHDAVIYPKLSSLKETISQTNLYLVSLS